MREAQKLDAELKHLVLDLNDFNFVLNKEHNLTYHVQNEIVRPFIPLSMLRQTFNAVHNPTHMGPHATKLAVCKRFYWPKMRRDIDRWVKSCILCQKAKVTRHNKPAIIKIPPASDKFRDINLDVVGLLPSDSGY